MACCSLWVYLCAASACVAACGYIFVQLVGVLLLVTGYISAAGGYVAACGCLTACDWVYVCS